MTFFRVEGNIVINQPLQSVSMNGKTPLHAFLQDPVLRSAYERLDQYDTDQGDWKEVLVEDRRAGPAAIATRAPSRDKLRARIRPILSRPGRVTRTHVPGA